MVRNDNDYIEHVKLHKRKINYMKALEALRKSEMILTYYNPAYHIHMYYILLIKRLKK